MSLDSFTLTEDIRLTTESTVSGTSKVYTLDENIDRKSKTLARLITKKISKMIGNSVKDAHTISIRWDEDLHRYTISKITSYRKVIHRFVSDAEASAVVSDFDKIVEEVNHYIHLGGSKKLRKLNRVKSSDSPLYSLYLDRDRTSDKV